MPKIHDVASIVCLLLLSRAIKVERRYSSDPGEANSCSGSHVGVNQMKPGALSTFPEQFLSLFCYWFSNHIVHIQVVVHVRGDTRSKAFVGDLSDLYAGHVEQTLALSPGPHLCSFSLVLVFVVPTVKQDSAERKSLMGSLRKETRLQLLGARWHGSDARGVAPRVAELPWLFQCVKKRVGGERVCTTGEIFHQLSVLSMCSWWLGPELLTLPLGPEGSVRQTTGGEHWVLYSPYAHHCKAMGAESNKEE